MNSKEQRALARAERTGRSAPMEQPTTRLRVPGPDYGLRIGVIPDAQVKPGVPIDHLAACGRYMAEQQPHVIVCIGDFADCPSLSDYLELGSKEIEGQRYQDDIDSVHRAMDAFMNPIAKARGYNPVLVFNLGNHEHRIPRTVEKNPRLLDRRMSVKDLRYEDYGWRVFPFLQPVSINNVVFCHYFPSGVMGRPIITARAQLNKLHMSSFAGHQQGRDVAYSKRADGGHLTSIISGSFYQHKEDYLSPFTNLHWRGMYMLNEVKDGQYDEMAVSINYLQRRFK